MKLTNQSVSRCRSTRTDRQQSSRDPRQYVSSILQLQQAINFIHVDQQWEVPIQLLRTNKYLLVYFLINWSDKKTVAEKWTVAIDNENGDRTSAAPSVGIDGWMDGGTDYKFMSSVQADDKQSHLSINIVHIW